MLNLLLARLQSTPTANMAQFFVVVQLVGKSCHYPYGIFHSHPIAVMVTEQVLSTLSRPHKGEHTHTYTNTHSFLFSLLLFVVFRWTPLFSVIHKCNFAFAIFDSQTGCCCNRQMIIIESSQNKMFANMQHAMLLCALNNESMRFRECDAWEQASSSLLTMLIFSFRQVGHKTLNLCRI